MAKGADCKSAGLRLRWFESSSYHHSDFQLPLSYVVRRGFPLAIDRHHQVHTAIFVDDKAWQVKDKLVESGGEDGRCWNGTKTVSMKTLARFFIVATVISFAVSLTGPGSEFLWGFLKPLSALLFGAFFISNLLAKEYAQYDEEHEYRMELARKQKSEPTNEDDEVPATEGYRVSPTSKRTKIC